MILRRFNGKAGRKKALKEFTLDRMFHETEMVYHEVLQEVRRGRKMKGKNGADP